MATNKTPRELPKLLSLSEDAADGAQTHGPAAGLAQNTAAKIRVNIAALKGDDTATPPTLGSIAIYDAAKTAKTVAKTEENAMEKAGRDFIAAAIGALKPRLGKQWNSGWNAAGFTGGSLEVPSDPLPPLASLNNYFLANPTHQVTSTDGLVNISAGAATTLYDDIPANANATGDGPPSPTASATVP